MLDPQVLLSNQWAKSNCPRRKVSQCNILSAVCICSAVACPGSIPSSAKPQSDILFFSGLLPTSWGGSRSKVRVCVCMGFDLRGFDTAWTPSTLIRSLSSGPRPSELPRSSRTGRQSTSTSALDWSTSPVMPLPTSALAVGAAHTAGSVSNQDIMQGHTATQCGEQCECVVGYVISVSTVVIAGSFRQQTTTQNR